MNRSETLKIMAVLRGAYPGFYRDISRTEAEDTVNLWADMFAHEDYLLVAAAVKSVIEADEKGFPPTIGQVKSKLRMITGEKEITDGDAWFLVANAIRNGIYGAKEEFDRLPPEVQKAVGSPNMLREWARMDADTVHSVVASNFQRSYRTTQSRKKELEALPPEVRQLVAQVAETALAEKPTPQALPERQRPAWLEEPKEVPVRRSREEVLRMLKGEIK